MIRGLDYKFSQNKKFTKKYHCLLLLKMSFFCICNCKIAHQLIILMVQLLYEPAIRSAFHRRKIWDSCETGRPCGYEGLSKLEFWPLWVQQTLDRSEIRAGRAGNKHMLFECHWYRMAFSCEAKISTNCCWLKTHEDCFKNRHY
jgi:hypothetical protein